MSLDVQFKRYLIFIAVIVFIPIVFSGRLSYYVSMLAICGIYVIIVLGLQLLQKEAMPRSETLKW